MTNGMGTTLSLNGLPDDYFIFLENGKRLYGDDTYARINVAKIKRIEILNGASSALYGTNAIGGVINIITDDAKNAINVSSDTRYASKGRFTQSVNADVNTGKFGSYTSYRRQQAEGWQLNPYEENSKTHELEETGKVASTGFYANTVNQNSLLMLPTNSPFMPAADIMTTRHAALMKHTTTTYCMKPLIMVLVPNT